MLKVMDEMQSLQPTSGYFVLVPTGGTPRYGGTPEGNSFVTDEYETVVSGFCKGLDKQTTSRQVITVHDIRQLFNRKCVEAVGQPSKKMPYKAPGELEMEGLPKGIKGNKNEEATVLWDGTNEEDLGCQGKYQMHSKMLVLVPVLLLLNENFLGNSDLDHTVDGNLKE